MGKNSETSSKKAREGKTNEPGGSATKKNLSSSKKAAPPTTEVKQHGRLEENEKGHHQEEEVEMQLVHEDADLLQELIQKLVTFKEEKKTSNSSSAMPNSSLDLDLFFEEVRLQQIANGFSHEVRLYLVLEVLFRNGSLTAKGVEENLGLLKRFITSGHMGFQDLIWAFDLYVGRNAATGAAKRFPMVVKALYDADLADEEEILAHYKAEKQQVPEFEVTARKAVAPLLNWLETAEDEDEDEE